MDTTELLKSALAPEPAQRFALVEEILRSLDRPDPAVYAPSLEVAEHRLAAYRAGQVVAIDAEEVIGRL
jgi:hypothetical protein